MHANYAGLNEPYEIVFKLSRQILPDSFHRLNHPCQIRRNFMVLWTLIPLVLWNKEVGVRVWGEIIFPLAPYFNFCVELKILKYLPAI